MPDPSRQRIFVTGAGIVSPLGLGWRENEISLEANKTAFRPVIAFDVSQRVARTAASLDLPEERLFQRVSRRREALVDRGTKMLLLAVREALASARLSNLDGIDALVIGTSAGAMMIGQDYFRHARASGARQPSQLARLEFYQPQRQLSLIAAEYDWQGPLLLVSNACASGANAIGDAMSLIRQGRARRVLAGGYDALAELVFSGFDTLRALAPSGIPRPFDAARDGLALGEGAGVVILESEEAAAERGVTALCEAAGYATATDLHHLTQPDPEGRAAIQTMTRACAMAGLVPEQVDYINSHGTGTPYNDIAEACAISAWAGDAVGGIAVSSTKSAMGHLLGGAGAVEAVLCVMALRGQWLPGSLNVREVDPAVRFDLVREFRRAPLSVALTNSFGFGGTNATLALRLETPSVSARPCSLSSPSTPAPLVIRGCGAVSPAGWGSQSLAQAMLERREISTVSAERPYPGREWVCPARMVPSPPPGALPKFSRLRRASAITRFAIGAAVEALEAAGFPQGRGAGRLGIVHCVFNGCVQFSGKFYQEVLDTPALASPIIFPETVYNAPISHVAAYLNADGPVTTLTGESNLFMEGVAMAERWLREGEVDHCLVMGSEECDWLGAEATTYYHPDLIGSEGSGAILLGLGGSGPKLTNCHGPFAYLDFQQRAPQMRTLVDHLSSSGASVLVDSQCGVPMLDEWEAAAWEGRQPSLTLSPRRVLGEGMGAAAALQMVLAAELAQQRHETVAVSMPGTLVAAYGAVVDGSVSGE